MPERWRWPNWNRANVVANLNRFDAAFHAYTAAQVSFRAPRTRRGSLTEAFAQVAPSIMPIKVRDSDRWGAEFGLVDGIHDAAVHGANVINVSLSMAAASAVVAQATTTTPLLQSLLSWTGLMQNSLPNAFTRRVATGRRARRTGSTM